MQSSMPTARSASLKGAAMDRVAKDAAKAPAAIRQIPTLRFFVSGGATLCVLSIILLWGRCFCHDDVHFVTFILHKSIIYCWGVEVKAIDNQYNGDYNEFELWISRRATYGLYREGNYANFKKKSTE